MKPAIVITCHEYITKFGIPCVESVIENTPTPRLILVYDNESTHPRAPELLTRWAGIDDVHAIRIDDQRRNGGLTGTWNHGVRRALEEGCDRIVFLNHDTLVNETWPEFLGALTNPRVVYGPMSNRPGSLRVHQCQYAAHGPLGAGTKRASIVNGFCFGINLNDMEGKWHSPGLVFNPSMPFGGNELEFQRRFFRERQGAHAEVVLSAWVYHWKNAAWSAMAGGPRYEDERSWSGALPAGDTTSRFIIGSGGGPTIDEIRVTLSPDSEVSLETPPIGRVITLSAVIGLYVSARNTDNVLIANWATAGTYEQFKVVDAGDGYIGLQCMGNEKYVCTENAGSSSLAANRSSLGDNGKFSWVYDSGQVGFVAAANGMYVCAENRGKEPLIANRTKMRSYESFGVEVYQLPAENP